MSAATLHCDRIIALIDDCLADDNDHHRPNRRSYDPGLMAVASTWSRVVPTAGPLGAPALATRR